MKVKFIKALNYVLGLLLAAIGFTSCSKLSNKDDRGEMVMYGTPTADYQISGKVTDVNSVAIEGISVSVFSRDIVDAITDKDGNYNFEATASGPWNLVMTIQDVDGVENGEFETKVRTETFQASDFVDVGQNGWHQGTATRTVDIKLTKKTTQEE